MSLSDVHVLLDLSGAPRGRAAKRHPVPIESLVALAREGGWPAHAVRVLLPETLNATLEPAVEAARAQGWSVLPASLAGEAWSAALVAAAFDRASLLVLFGSVEVSREALEALGAPLAADPYFGVAAPRFETSDREGVLPVGAVGGAPGGNARVARSSLSAQPEWAWAETRLEPAMLVRPELVRLFADPEAGEGWCSVGGATLDLLDRARRLGFRVLRSHRALAKIDLDWGDPAAQIPAEDRARLEVAADPKGIGAESVSGFGAAAEAEAWPARPDGDVQRSMLLDLSDLGAVYNGTSDATLSLLTGLASTRAHWEVDLLVEPGVAAFHGLSTHAPGFRHVWPAPTRRYTVAFRPIQPWSLGQVERLHELGFFVFVTMFDTILADSGMAPALRLDLVWQATAELVDGIAYISAFTQDRFRARYPLADGVDEQVSLLPTTQEDLGARPTTIAGDPSEGFILIIGNDLPHKWVEPTVRDLVAAFPGEDFRALGFQDPRIPQLGGFKSGTLVPEVVDGLYRDAGLLVFPSLYEGFGIPVLRGLAEGKTVVARAGALLEEVAAHARGPGRLIAYDGREALTEIVARLRKGGRLPASAKVLSLGSALSSDASGVTARRYAETILGMIDRRVAEPNVRHRLARVRFFERLAYDRATGDER